MFEATEINIRNRKTEKLFKILFLLMTGLLILPVALILIILTIKGGSIVSLEFLFTNPTEGMTAGGIFPALVGTIWLVAVALRTVVINLIELNGFQGLEKLAEPCAAGGYAGQESSKGWKKDREK